MQKYSTCFINQPALYYRARNKVKSDMKSTNYVKGENEKPWAKIKVEALDINNPTEYFNFIVRVSLVQISQIGEKYKVHPNLFLHLNEQRVPYIDYELFINQEIELKNIVIERCIQKDLLENLNILQSYNFDPYNEGFDFSKERVSFTQFRLCVSVISQSNPTITLAKPIVSKIFGLLSSESGLYIKEVQRENKNFSIKFNNTKIHKGEIIFARFTDANSFNTFDAYRANKKKPYSPIEVKLPDLLNDQNEPIFIQLVRKKINGKELPSNLWLENNLIQEKQQHTNLIYVENGIVECNNTNVKISSANNAIEQQTIAANIFDKHNPLLPDNNNYQSNIKNNNNVDNSSATNEMCYENGKNNNTNNELDDLISLDNLIDFSPEQEMELRQIVKQNDLILPKSNYQSGINNENNHDDHNVTPSSLWRAGPENNLIKQAKRYDPLLPDNNYQSNINDVPNQVKIDEVFDSSGCADYFSISEFFDNVNGGKILYVKSRYIGSLENYFARFEQIGKWSAERPLKIIDNNITLRVPQYSLNLNITEPVQVNILFMKDLNGEEIELGRFGFTYSPLSFSSNLKRTIDFFNDQECSKKLKK